MPIFKVRKIPLSSIIRFGSENQPFDLVDITSDTSDTSKNFFEFLEIPGDFIYETRFSVNEVEARRQKVTDIKFEFFAGKPGAGSVPLKSCDFLIKISEPKIGIQSSPEHYQKLAIFNGAAGFQGILNAANSLKLVSNEQQFSPTPYKLAAKDKELLNKEDPAKLVSAGKTLGTTPGNAMSFGTQSKVPELMSTNFDRVGSKSSNRTLSLAGIKENLVKRQPDDSRNTLTNSLLGLQRITSPQSLVRAQPVVMAEIVTSDVEYTRQLSFDKKDLLGFTKLYVKVSGVTKTSVVATVTPKTYIIPHIAEVKDFFGNAAPPVVKKLENSFGRVSFSVSRVDPTLRRVAVIRITKNPNLVKSFFENVAVIEFEDSDTVFFEQSVDNVAPNVIIYRFIVQNEDGSYGDFVSSVVDSYTKVSDQKKVLSSTTPISIRAINTVDGIQVSVDTVNDQVYSLRLLRQDLASIGEFSQTVTTILDQDGRYSQSVRGESRTFDFLDRDVVNGRHYRYFAAYRLGSFSSISICQETMSDEDETIVRTTPSARLPFSADITPAISLQNSDNATEVQFELQVTEIEEQYNVLIDALQQAGVGQQFITDLQNDRQKARQVAAFLVERVDRVTGRRASFGIVSPGKFTDSPLIRNKLGIPDPLPGRKYEYVCKLCIRPPATFLLTALVGFVPSNESNLNITQVLAAKFQNALISRGILPSEKQLKDGTSIRENFLLGQTGIEITTSITLLQFAPKIDEIVVKEKRFYNSITWKALGDLTEVSYFLVYCNYNGTDELVGSVSSVGKSAIYQFRDTRFHNEVGQKNYSIKIVNVDHDVLAASPQVQTVTNFSIPAPTIDGVILLPSRYEIKGAVIPVGKGIPFAPASSPAPATAPATAPTNTDIGIVTAAGLTAGITSVAGVGGIGGFKDFGVSLANSAVPLPKLDIAQSLGQNNFSQGLQGAAAAVDKSSVETKINPSSNFVNVSVNVSALPLFGLADPSKDLVSDSLTKMQGIYTSLAGAQNQIIQLGGKSGIKNQLGNSAAANAPISKGNIAIPGIGNSGKTGKFGTNSF